jgi:hypothetical protein
MTRKSDRKYGSPYAKGETPMPLVNLQQAQHYVAARRPFDASMCCGRRVPQINHETMVSLMDETVMEMTTHHNYVVYTGTPEHQFPLFVYDEFAEAWFENTNSLYGAVTTKQRKRLRPHGEVHVLDNSELNAVALYGYTQVAKLRLANQRAKRPWQDELRSFMSRSSAPKAMKAQALEQWRKRHVINGGPSIQQIYDELTTIIEGKGK